MAEQAQALLAGSGWLPEPLRTPGQVFTAAAGRRSRPTGQPAPTGRSLMPNAAAEAWPIAAE